MLRPIKTFLTYLQKNANGSTIFGGTSSAGMSETNIETDGDLPSSSSLQPPQTTETLEVASKTENEINIEKDDVIMSTTTSQKSTPHDQNENEVVDDTVDCGVTKTSNDEEDNGNQSNDDIEIIENEPPKIDLCTDSNDEGLLVASQNQPPNLIELNTESNEVIILEETNHSDSISDPLHDPLAIDDYNADISSNNITLAATNSGQSDLDTSAEGEILFEVHVPAIAAKQTNDHDNRNFTSRLEEVNNEEVRSDGSDSGLGSETSTLQSANTSVVAVDSSPPVNKPQQQQHHPARSNLKRRSDDVHMLVESKRPKRSINFNGVSVYYFPRIQGFACVPSQGGCTLGMAAHHVHSKTFTLAEHAAEQRRVHKQQMQEINPRGSSSDETDSDEEISEASGSDLDADANGFLQPVPARQRRALLKSAGIRKIDPTEKDDCRAIRSSREFCGCSCRGYCDPDTCSCSQAGIKCQVDRPSFPCGCTRDGCANVVGRVEFNPSRVRTHYIHTIMRLDLENKQKRADELDSAAAGSSMLSYANSSVTSSMISSGGNSLNNLCNYNNLVNTNHIRQQQQQLYGVDVVGSAGVHLQHSPSSYASDASIYSNRLHGSLISTPTSQLQVDSQQRLSPRLLDNSASNSSHTLNDGLSITLQSPATNQDIDLHYAFRDENTTGATVTAVNSNNLLGLGDYPATSSSLYHEVYNGVSAGGGHSFLNQNYSNAAFCSPQNTNYASYQQNFISYASTASTPVDISDLPAVSSQPNGESILMGTAATADTTNNYISSIGNASRVDTINDLVHSSRTTATSSCIASATTNDPVTLVGSSSSTSCVLAPSAQTSTSITEGTQTTITQPQSTKSTIGLVIERKTQNFVDLTVEISPKIEEKQTENGVLSGGIGVIELNETKDIKIDIDSIATDSTITTTSSSSSSSSSTITTATAASPTCTKNLAALPLVDDLVASTVDENLSDIIKNSIVEIVLA